MKKLIFLIIIAVALISIFHDLGKKEDPLVLDFSSEKYGDVDPHGLKLSHGDLLSIKQSGSIVVVKAKITENLSNQLTIDQNYFNVQDLIKKNGFNTCSELQYWAVIDKGMETKVISFDLDKTAIDSIYSDKVIGSDIEKVTKNLWIAPALQNKNTD